MAWRFIPAFILWAAFFLLAGCATNKPDIPVSKESVKPGSSVTFKGDSFQLLGDTVSVGDELPSVKLVNSMTMQEVDLSKEKGKVLFLSLVPSVDTKVCEAQTHYLGEEGDQLPGSVRRITISRDTPFAHQRFAEEAELADIEYLSDYKQGAFARAMGLLTEGLMLVARSIVLVDQSGVIQYIQVVPEITHLPDMEKAFDKATQMADQD